MFDVTKVIKMTTELAYNYVPHGMFDVTNMTNVIKN